MTQPPELELDRVTKRFGHNTVLDGISLSIEQGLSFALIGKSGEGKSVALKIMLGLMPCEQGQVRTRGEELARHLATWRQSIGVLFQGGALFDSLPVWKNVAFAGLRGRQRMDARQARRTAEEKLERVGLDTTVADHYPAELSGGMQRRVGIARAVFAQPRLLFLDEPTTGLDPVRSRQITDLIATLLADSSMTAVTISHDMDFVTKVATRAALLDGGRIVWMGESGTILDDSDDRLSDFVHGRNGIAND